MGDDLSASATRIARAITWLSLKILATAAVLFGLLRVVSPNLMTRHDSLSFWVGAACWPLALVLLVWAAIWIAQDIKAIRGLFNDRKRLPRVL